MVDAAITAVWWPYRRAYDYFALASNPSPSASHHRQHLPCRTEHIASCAAGITGPYHLSGGPCVLRCFEAAAASARAAGDASTTDTITGYHSTDAAGTATRSYRICGGGVPALGSRAYMERNDFRHSTCDFTRSGRSGSCAASAGCGCGSRGYGRRLSLDEGAAGQGDF